MIWLVGFLVTNAVLVAAVVIASFTIDYLWRRHQRRLRIRLYRKLDKELSERSEEWLP